MHDGRPHLPSKERAVGLTMAHKEGVALQSGAAAQRSVEEAKDAARLLKEELLHGCTSQGRESLTRTPRWRQRPQLRKPASATQHAEAYEYSTGAGPSGHNSIRTQQPVGEFAPRHTTSARKW